MKVELSKLKPNSLRDFDLDPIDADQVRQLEASIHESGFWGGSAVRYGPDGDLETIVGTTRIVAAMNTGITHADLHVGRYTDEVAIRMYATENVTQRSASSGLAQAGAVASAVRYLIKGILKGDKHVSQICETSDKGLETIRGQIASEKGLGEPCLIRFFHGIEGMNPSAIKHHLANLKTSGEYRKIVIQVTEELAKEAAIEQEHSEAARKEAEQAEAKAQQLGTEEAQQQLSKARRKKTHAETQAETSKQTAKTSQKAATAAAKRPVTFDLIGVGKYLKTQELLNAFRKVVTRESMKKNVPVSVQADLAATLCKHANKHNDGKVTGKFIELYLPKILQNVSKWSDLKLSQQAAQQIERENIEIRWKKLSHGFCRNIGAANHDALEMIAMKDDHPDLPFSVTNELRTTVKFAHLKIKELAEKLRII